jgi:hypothetical protein
VRRRRGLVAAALGAAALLLGAGTARAGTYDVTTCSPSGPGGVNHAWTFAVHRVDGGAPTSSDLAGYVHDESCLAPSGLSIRSNSAAGDRLATWGTWAIWEFAAPPGTEIRKLMMWRYANVARTNTGSDEGRWDVFAREAPVNGGGPEIGGTFGPDQCKPGFVAFPNPCIRGARGFGADAVSNDDLATTGLGFGIACDTDTADLHGCHTAAGAAPLGEFAMQAAVVTIGDDSAPAVDAAGGVLDPGWQHPDAQLTWSASDNVGIRDARVLLDGQQHGQESFACDFTYPLPCANVASHTVGLGDAPIADGQHQLQLVVDDAAGNPATITQTVSFDSHGPDVTLTRASGKTIAASVTDGASGVAGATVEVRDTPSAPFRALPTQLAAGKLTATLDHGSAAKVGIRITAADVAGNVTAGQVNGISLRVRTGGHTRTVRGGATWVLYGHSAVFSGRLLTRDGVGVAGVPIQVERLLRTTGAQPQILRTITTDAKGRFSYFAAGGASRRLRFISPGAADVLPTIGAVALQVRATSTIHASRRVLHGRGRVSFSGRLGLQGATVPRSGKLIELQAFDAGRWRTFATARARGSKGAWHSAYTFAGKPGRYPVRVRIRREAVFPYDLGYSRSVVVRIR